MVNKKRKSIFKLFIAILVIALSTITASTPVFANNFSDTDNHWAKSYIETISTYNGISGYPDGTFKPNHSIKRIEFITIIVNSLGLDTSEQTDDEYWGQPFIEAAILNGLIISNEYGDMDVLTFDKNISREEMANIIVNAYTNSGGVIDPLILSEASTRLSDLNTVAPRYYNNAVASVSLDFILGYPDGSFAPKEYATRAQAAIMSYRLLVKLGTITDGKLPINIVLSKTTLHQGDLLKISIYHAESTTQVSLVQTLYPDFKWSDNDRVIEGYLPTNYNTKPGQYSLQFTDTITGITSRKDINIVARDFRIQHLKVSSSVDSSTRNDAAYAQYYKYFNPSRDISSPTKYYTESFLLPTKGRVSTEFGETRYVNGSPTSYRHAGIDITAPKNADVLSTNRGKVMLSMSLTLTGNSIVIDHGEGLFSVYFHLEKLFVSEGDIVERGQLIGAVGSTGFSTGPHLHFMLSYYRFNLEPGYFLYGQSMTKDNYLELMK